MSELPDRARVTAYYDENDECFSIEVALNTDEVSREDLDAIIRAVFRPDGINVTVRHRSPGPVNRASVAPPPPVDHSWAGPTQATVSIPRGGY